MTKKKQSSAPAGQLAPVITFSMIAIWFALAAVLFIALWSYQPSDPAWSHNNGGVVQNTLGTVGAWYSDLSFSLIGQLSYLMPLALLAFCVQAWFEKGIDKELFSWRLFMLLTAILSGCVLFAKHDPNAINTVAQTGGGAVGAWLAIGLEKSIKSVPVIMAFSLVIFLISMSLLLSFPWAKIMEWIGKGISTIVAGLFGGFAAGREKKVKKPDNAMTASSEANDALQEKIKHLNQMAEKKHEEKKPAFTIDRYEPESLEDGEFGMPTAMRSDEAVAVSVEPLLPETADEIDYETPAFQRRQRATVQSSQPNQIPVQPESVQPFTQEAELRARPQPQTNSQPVSKSEPTFFDFDEMSSTSSIPVSPLDEIERMDNVRPQPVEPVMQQTSQAAQVAATQAFQPEPLTAEPIADAISHEVNTPLTTQFEHSISEVAQSASTVIEPSPALSQALQSAEPEAAFSADSPAIEPIDFSVKPEVESVENATQQEMASHSQHAVSNAAQTSVQQVAVDNAVSNTMETAAATTMAAVGTGAINKVSIGKAYDTQSSQTAQPVVKHHELPSIDLLDTPPPQENAYTEDALAQMAGVLERTLQQFNVDATVMHVSPGPVITRFEIDLAPGIQAKKITGLSTDLARALAVSGVRVEEVIPGSSYVGLEVPNKQRQVVYFKDVVRSKAFQNSQSPLTLSLGSDTSGKPVVADLMKMPHALVAGTTGSGKSVCINVMLLSMLYKSTPAELRLILVDPKMLEMSMYEDIPHLLTPVITDMNEAENALTWAVGEMERRYQLMAALKVRKIDAFNKAVDEANARGEPIKDPLWEPNESVGYTHHPSLERLPFIVIVIDELADMMMVVGKQVEQLIARLTQKARAAGIHVVLATQRPSTDVLTGLIKANVPTRIAFQVSSGTDSRVIIDGVGAEKLLGHGDMLYVPPGAGHPNRLHGAFVNDSETDRITEFLRSTGEPDYIHGITGKQDPETLGAFGAAEAADAKEDADPLYEDAINIVLTTGKASISSVQRQLRIGYNRAARMIEDMQEQGIVSEPVNGVRKVLASPPPKEDI